MTKPHIILLGCGNMGGAMLEGWRKINSACAIDIIDHHVKSEHENESNITFHTEVPNTINFKSKNTVLLIAVKPQILSEACLPVKHLLHNDTLILSIAAGKSISNLETVFGQKQPIIRAMPNTPAAIGQGITAAIANEHVNTNQKQTAEELLSAIGKWLWIDEEEHMDAVTALSGSGPAYLFHMIEALTEAGKSIGLDNTTAETLARQTIIGSAALADHKPETSAETLRQNVTSPGGTTEAALKVLMNDQKGLTNLLTETLKSAANKSRELSH